MADRDLRLRMILEGLDKLTGPLKAVAGASGSTRKELADTRAELKALDAAQQDIGKFKGLEGNWQKTHADLAATESRMAELRAQIEATDKPTAKLRKEFEKTERQTEQLRGRLGQEGEELQKLTGKLSAAGIDTADLGKHEDRLAMRTYEANKALRAQTDALERQAQAHRNSEKLRDISGKATSLGIGLMGAGTAAAAPVAVAVKQAMTLESAMADVRKVVDFPTPEAFRQMSDDVLDLSTRVPMAAEGIAQIVAAGGRAGIAREDLLKFAEDSAKMGVAFESTAEEAGAMMAKWRTAFGMGQGEVVELADQINALTNSFGGNVAAVTDVVTRIGPLGDVAGVAAPQIAAIAQLMSSVGVESEVGATGIKNMMLTLTKGGAATKRQSAAFKALGLDAVQVSKNMQRDAGGTILKVMEGLKALPKETQAGVMTNLFGSESVGALAPMLTGLDKLKRNFEMVGDKAQYAGSMQQEYESAIDKAQGATDLAMNGLKALNITMGNALLPTVKIVAEKVSGLANSVRGWAKEHPTLAKAIMMFMGVGGGLLIVLGGLALAFAAVTAAAAPLGIALAPLLLIIAAVAALAAAAYLIYDNWGAIVQWWNDLWASIGEIAAGALQLLIDGFLNFTPLGLFIQAMMPVLDYLRGINLFEIGQQLIAGLIRGVTDKLKALKDTVIGAASAVSNWFKEKLGIHSPSRVFAQFGGFMMQGLEGGIAADQAGPLDRIKMISADITRAMAMGAAAPAIAATPAAAAAPPAPSLGDITIVIKQLPGQDSKDLARLVREALEDIKRGEAAAARSRFADDQDYGGFA